MQLNINGKDMTLHFGIDFIEELDKKYVVESNGAKFGMGVNTVLVYLNQGNPTVLPTLIHAATSTVDMRPGETEIKRWVENYEDLDGLFESFLSELSTQRMTKGAVEKMKRAQEKAKTEAE